MANEFFKAMRNIEEMSKKNVEQFEEINRIGKVSAAANVAIAVNSARQVAIQTEQLNLGRERAVTDQRYQLSMWRQTPEGREYTAWSHKARQLLQVFQSREEAWRTAWMSAVARTVNEIPLEELQRFKRRSWLLRQLPLLLVAIVFALLAFLSVWISVYAFAQVSADNGWSQGTPLNLIGFVLMFTIPSLCLVASVGGVIASKQHSRSAGV
ncbi:Uncharacterised protein [Mycobacteroides abscessus subsp. abscessus]|nr:Uncharacterised protein [Mycobacteroides abscessus subsp. abscessus]